MALVRRTMENIRRLKPRISRVKIDATTEADIRRHISVGPAIAFTAIVALLDAPPRRSTRYQLVVG
jgi:hypothetical protein